MLKHCLLFFCFIFIGFIIYQNGLYSSYIFEDDTLDITQSEPFFRQGLIPTLIHFFNTPTLSDSERPITALSFWVNYKIFGPDPLGFRLVSLFIHALVCFSIFFLCKNWPGVNPSSLAAAAAALLFLVHPLHVSAVQLFVVERAVLLAGLFGICSLIFFLKYIRSPKRIFLGLSLTCLVLSVLSKPDGVAFLLILLGFITFFRIRLPLWAYPTFFLIPSILLVFFVLNLHPINPLMAWYKYLSVQTRVTAAYLWLFFWPFDLNSLYSIKPDPNIFHNGSWAFILGHLSVLTIIFGYLRKYNVPFFLAGISIYLAFIPESSFFPLQTYLYEYRAYLPYIFLSVLIYLFILKMPQPKIGVAILLCICVIFSFTTYSRSVKRSLKLNYDIAFIKDPRSMDQVNYRIIYSLIIQGEKDKMREALRCLISQNRPSQDIYKAIYIMFNQVDKPLNTEQEKLVKTYLEQCKTAVELSCLLRIIEALTISPIILDRDSFKHDILFNKYDLFLNSSAPSLKGLRSELHDIDKRLINRYLTQKTLKNEEEIRLNQAQAVLRLLSMSSHMSIKNKFNE